MDRLTKKEKGFAEDYINTGNGTESALKNYDTTDENCAAVIASKNIRKVKIQNYLESIASDAAIRVEELSKTAKNENVKLNANKDILDRAGYKPVDRSDITSGNKPIPILGIQTNVHTNSRSEEDTSIEEEN